MLPIDVLNKWFDSHAAGDLAAARSLMVGGARITVPGAQLHGFDEFMEWYRERVAAHPTFSYRVVELLSGEAHAAAVLALQQDGADPWRQLVLYEIRDGRIRSIWAVEEA